MKYDNKNRRHYSSTDGIRLFRDLIYGGNNYIHINKDDTPYLVLKTSDISSVEQQGKKVTLRMSNGTKYVIKYDKEN